MKVKQFVIVLVSVLALLTAACGSVQQAVEQRVAEEIVDQVGGDGSMATIEAAATAVQTELDRRDLDGDGEVSEEEAQTAANQPGVSPLNPLTLESGQLYEGNANLLTPLFYQANVPAGGVVTLHVENKGTADLNLSLSNAPSSDYPTVVTAGQTVSLPLQYGSETAQLLVTLHATTDVPFVVSAAIATQNDGNTGADGGDFDTPTAIAAGTGYTGNYGGRDTEDYFTLRLQPNELLEVVLTSSAENTEPMVLYGELSDGQYYTLDNILPGNQQTLALGSLGENLAKFGFYGGSSAQYSFDVVVRPADDHGTGGDVGDSVSTAVPITSGETVRGISVSSDNDCYQFSLSQPAVIAVSLTSPDEQINDHTATVELRDATGAYLQSATAEKGFANNFEYGSSDDPALAGDYLLCAQTYSFWFPYGIYEFVLTVR